jgi:hypothetical protein
MPFKIWLPFSITTWCSILNLIFNHSKESMSVYGYRHQPTKTPLVALWLDGKNVTNSFETTQVNITFENINFKTPVWVDLMTGSIHEIPKSQWSKSGSSCTFNIPLYDSPVLITEKVVFSKIKTKMNRIEIILSKIKVPFLIITVLMQFACASPKPEIEQSVYNHRMGELTVKAKPGATLI